MRKGEREIKEREREREWRGPFLSFSLFPPSHTTLSSPSFSSPRTILSIPPTLNHPFSVTLAALFSPFCSTFFPLRRATLPPLSLSLFLSFLSPFLSLSLLWLDLTSFRYSFSLLARPSAFPGSFSLSSSPLFSLYFTPVCFSACSVIASSSLVRFLPPFALPFPS